MTSIARPTEFRVTDQTRLGELESFIQNAGSGGKQTLRGKESDGAIVLYVAPDKKPSLWERFKQLFSRRQDQPEEARARDQVRNIFLRSLPEHLSARKDFLRSDVAAGRNGLSMSSLHADIQAFKALTSDRPVGEGDQFDTMERFAGQQGKNVGGKTGSVRVKADGTNYQLKFDISRAGTLRQAGERGLNVQNLGEVISSALLRAEFAAAAPKAVKPQVEYFQRDDSGLLPDVFSENSGIKRRSVFERMEDDDIKPDTPEPATATVEADAAAPANPQLAPKVTLLNSVKQAEIAVVSEYLPGGQGDLENYFKDKLGGTLAAGRHVKVEVGSEQGTEGQPMISAAPAVPGKVRLQGQAVTDLCNHLANAAWLADHDFNPGGLIVLERERLGRIDSAHMGANLLHGAFGSEAQLRETLFHGGSGTGSDNAIVDFVNQKSLRGKMWQSTGGVSKLWRDYQNLVPSLAFAHALQRLSQRGEVHREGLLPAMQQVLGLAVHLASEPSEINRKKLENLVASVARVSAHMGRPIQAQGMSAEEVIVRAFNNMGEVLTERRRDAAYAGDLCELQASINAHYQPKPGGPTVSREQLVELRVQFEERHAKLLSSRKVMVWFAESAEAPPFRGSIDEFIQQRRAAAQS